MSNKQGILGLKWSGWLGLLIASMIWLVGVGGVRAVCDPAMCVSDLECNSDEVCAGDCCIPPDPGDGTWTCFPAGTDVRMASGENKDIENIEVGDEVVSQDTNGNKTVSRVSELDQPIRDHMCRVSFVDGDTLELTNEHPLWTKDGWKAINSRETHKENPNLPVRDLLRGDEVQREDGTWNEVVATTCWSERVQAYNLILDGSARTYFAEGYLAHNKGCVNCCANGDERVRLGIYYCSVDTGCQFPDFRNVGFGNGTCSQQDYENEMRDCEKGACVPIATPTPTPTPTPPSCTVSVSPASATISTGETVTFTASVTPSNGTVSSVSFSSSNGGVATVSPSSDTTSPYSTVATGVGAGSATVTATVYMGGVATCNSSASGTGGISVTNPPVIYGTVYYDADNSCSTSAPSNLGGAQVQAGAEPAELVQGDGTYSITTSTAGLYDLALSGYGSYVCSSCGLLDGCPTKTSVLSPVAGPVNFYMTDSRGAWWQAEGAGVYSGDTSSGTTVLSSLPTSSDRMIIPGVDGMVGAVVRASGDVSVGGTGEVSDEGWKAISEYNGKRMDYTFFAGRMGISTTTDSDWSGNDIDLSTIAGSGKEAYYAEPISGNTITLGNDWSVGSGESYVVFVDGDLTINNDVIVTPGGFLAFVVNGDVAVDPSVTSMQGMYVMDGNWSSGTTGGTDVQLVTGGSIVAWGGVNLQRDLGSSNLSAPGEKFVYRPDLLVNMPDAMKNFLLNWQEVAPGS